MFFSIKITNRKQTFRPLFFGFFIFSTLLAGCQIDQKKENKTSEHEETRKISEMMGHLVIENLDAQHVNIDIKSFIKGLEEGKAGKTPPLSKEEFSQLFADYWKKGFDQSSAKNLAQAEKFLEENKKDPHVVSLSEGKVQYKILSPGSGETVQEENTPLILYEGKYQDGKVFDGSHAQGEPLALSLNTTIPGFKVGVLGMKKGEKRRLFIHPELGYGTQGRLQPNALLVFDIEVVEIDSKKEGAPGSKKKSSEKSAPQSKQLTPQSEELTPQEETP